MVRVDDILRAIDSFKDHGGRFVWTIHNVLPHESRFEELELHLRQELANRADLVHAMCDATREEIGRLYQLPVDRTLTVAHSSYLGIYPDATDRDLARRSGSRSNRRKWQCLLWEVSARTKASIAFSLHSTEQSDTSHVCASSSPASLVVLRVYRISSKPANLSRV